MSTNWESMILKDTAANRPAAGKPGRLFYDTTNEKLQRDSGSVWEDIEPGAGGTYTDEQAQDAIGAMIADTATINLTYTDATPELKADVIPTGIKLDDLGTPDDNTDLNVSITLHGLTPKLPNDATKYLNGTGGYTVPAGGSSMSNSNISPTTANITAAVNTRYFADISGLTADRNFILPTGAIGDVIELKIKTGDNAFVFNIIGDTGVSIEGGSTATLWSSVFITGEMVRLVLDTTSNWSVNYDGRKPCVGLLHLSAADTTNTAATLTTPTWDTKTIDRGEMGDTTNFRFNIRRANYYRISGSYLPNATITDQNYIYVAVKQNSTIVNDTIIYSSGTFSFSIPLSPKDVLCAVGDTLLYQYQPQQANKGILNDTRSFFQIEEVF